MAQRNGAVTASLQKRALAIDTRLSARQEHGGLSLLLVKSPARVAKKHVLYAFSGAQPERSAQPPNQPSAWDTQETVELE